jgi:hypothetical protein
VTPGPGQYMVASTNGLKKSGIPLIRSASFRMKKVYFDVFIIPYAL